MGEKEIHEAFLGMMKNLGVEVDADAPVEAEMHKVAEQYELKPAKKSQSMVAHYRMKAAKCLSPKGNLSEADKLLLLQKAQAYIAQAIAAQQAKMKAEEGK